MSTRISIVRESIIRIVRMLTEKKVQVTQRGSSAYVTYNHDGTPKVVNIPYIPEDATEELLVATQGFLDHEVAHVLFTDYEAVKIANQEGFASLYNIIEDSFIERKMGAAFAGSGFNLSQVGAYFLKNYTDTRLKSMKPGDPAIEGLLIVPAIRAWAGQTVYKDYMAEGDKWSLIKRITDRLEPVIDRVAKVTNSMDAANLAREMKKLLEIAPEPESPAPPPPKAAKSSGSKAKERKAGEKAPKRKKRAEEPETETEDAGEAGEGEDGDEAAGAPSSGGSAPLDGSESLPPIESDYGPDEDDGDEDDGLTPAAELDEGGDEDEDEDEDEPGEDEEATEVSTGGGSESAGGGSLGGGPSMARSEDLYKGIEREIAKDFDEELSKMITKTATAGMEKTRYKVYSKDFDRIEPLVVRESTYKEEYLKDMQESVDHMVGPLQKDFERAIAAKSATTWSGGHRSGRLHAAALSRLSTGDERVFRRKHINNSKDVAVGLLVDCSGSMSGMGKIKAAAYAAYALASVLDRMNISCEVLGFTTKGEMPKEMFAEESKHGFRYARTQPLYIPVLKGFNERLNSDTKRRFASLTAARWLNENVDGESVEIAAGRLSQRTEKRKVLFVFSDGQPACPGDWSQIHDHLHKVVKDVEQAGIEVMGIGIADNSAAKYYKKHVLLTNISDLPTTVIGEIKKILMK